MGKLLCVEIPKNEEVGMILVRLDGNHGTNKFTDIIVRNCDRPGFQFALENNKYIIFDSIAYVKSITPPTEDHGIIIELDGVNGDWIENVGYRIDLIRMYQYL